jgi:hypothetical protein
MAVERYEWSLHLTTDRARSPEFAWVTCEHENGQTFWVADQEFGPFDTLRDVYRFLARVVRAYRPPPGG